MKLAIVHERLTEFGGSERVVEEAHTLFPDAPIFVPIQDPATLRPALQHAQIEVSALQRVYRPGRSYAHLLPLLPAAMRSFDLHDFDVVLVSHHAFGHRIRTRPTTRVISYTHTPARWMWEREMQRVEVGGRLGRASLRAFAATQRHADRAAAHRVTALAANSRHVADRIRRWWGRDSSVIAPPVDTEYFTPPTAPAAVRDDFFLLAGRLVPYKRPEVAVLAANRAGVRLVVAGDGRSRAVCEALAGPTVEVLGRVSDEELRELYRTTRALVMPGEEDFGIIPVEAQACGAPVVALGVGGALDSVVDGTTGHLYRPSSDPVDALVAALKEFDSPRYSASQIRAHAQRFSVTRFRAELAALVMEPQ